MTLLKSGSATWVDSTKPSLTHGAQAQLKLVSGAAYGFIQVGLPADLHKGATVASAKLRIAQVGTTASSRTLTVQRVSAKWLLSKLTWNNKPGVTGSAVAVTQGGGPDGNVWEFDVTADVQLMANGTANYGWRITSAQASALFVRGFTASKWKPVLDVSYSYAPPTPTSLHPSSGAVSITKPVLTYDAGDTATQQRIQVDPAGNGTAPVFDTGWVATTVEEYDLSTSTYAGLALGASTQWRVQVKNVAGLTSAWSAWVSFNRVAKQVLTVTQPPATVYEPTPPFTFTMPDLQRSQVLIYDPANPSKVLHDSGVRTDTVGSYTPNKDVFTKDDTTYTYRVRAWDSVDREQTSGDTSYVQVVGTTTLSGDDTIAAVTNLVASVASPTPWVDVSWSRTNQPDGWAIYRDGVRVHTASTGLELLVAGTTYSWRDQTAAPNRKHSYKVQPVVNSVTGKGGPTAYVTPTGAGVWLLDPDTGTEVVLWGDDGGDWEYGEDTQTYLPIGASAPVLVTTSMRGLEGSWSGELAEVPSLPNYGVDSMEANLYLLKADPASVVRLVAGDLNIPVYLYEITLAPDPASKGGDRVVAVAFSFAQADELPYTAVL